MTTVCSYYLHLANMAAFPSTHASDSAIYSRQHDHSHTCMADHTGRGAPRLTMQLRALSAMIIMMNDLACYSAMHAAM